MTTGWRLGVSPHWLFDPNYYRIQYSTGEPANPLLHYCHVRSDDAQSTHILFEPTWYHKQLSDAKEADQPLLHYLRVGWREKWSPHPLFDVIWYLDQYPDVAKANINPFRHYLCQGWMEERNPHPLFDGKWYIERNADVAYMGVNPLLHFCSVGWQERRNPHPLFDTKWYLDQNRDVEEAGLNPLIHYVQSGWSEKRSTHPLFDPNWYLQEYPDVADAGLDPLRHYLSSGWRENRNPGPFFDTAWYRSRYIGKANECPLCLYLSRPERNLQQPHPLFDAEWYLASYGSQIASDTNLFVEYVARGIEAGCIPSPPYGRVKSVLEIDVDAPRAVACTAFVNVFKNSPSGNILKNLLAKSGDVLALHYEVWRAPQSLEGRHVCLFAVYAPDGYIPRSTLFLLRALKLEGFIVVCIVASKNSGLPYADEEFECDGLISRDSHGYDFASWALGLNVLPSIWKARTIIFINDSIFGPVTKFSLQKVLEKIESSEADYIALTQSWQIKHHYQSYFFAFKSRAICHPGVRRVWTTLQRVENRHEVIIRYEVPMLDTMKHLGLKTEIMFPLGERDFEKDMNPTLDHWCELLEEGFPFIKVQALRDDISGVDKNNWRARVAMNEELLSLIAERLDSETERKRKSVIIRFDK